MTEAMDGRLDGFPVRWRSIEEIAEVGYGTDDLPFAEYQRTTWAGPGRQGLQMLLLVMGAGHDRAAKSLMRSLRVEPVHVAYDPRGTYFDEQVSYIRVKSPKAKRNPAFTAITFEAEYLGNQHTHAVALVATAQQVTNTWGQTGLTALRVPGVNESPTGEAVDDAFRDVMQTPTAFAALDAAAYSAGASLRNALAPIVTDVRDPLRLYDGTVKATALGSRIAGSGEALGQGDSVENVSLRLTLKPLTSRVTVAGLELADSVDCVVPAYQDAVFAGAGLPNVAQRAILRLGNGQAWTLYANGNLEVQPLASGGLQFPGSAVRALGTGVFWHALTATMHLVADRDFAVDAAGIVTWAGSGAVFGVVSSNLAGAALTERLREPLMRTVPNWILQRRSL